MFQAYWYMTKLRVLTGLAYRFEVFASVGTNLILMVASVFLWKAAYSGGSGSGVGMTLHDLVTYTIVSILLASLFVTDVQDTIYYKIREGKSSPISTVPSRCSLVTLQKISVRCSAP
ncbi:ABC-2 type transport system permease protein [Paenibacillus taihuensis]|uniref:ABC-2 type transport system permease protein n=1 Tax=Paenibacillus taihuensis TaxID=1156355 RepID=A0A3D9SFV4_9BACL|nr:hypothetical protein [Paenibacillus taihuensis]REE89043.1 ABC-2 type transport system permease protein [Paenibacillus taihuensis]